MVVATIIARQCTMRAEPDASRYHFGPRGKLTMRTTRRAAIEVMAMFAMLFLSAPPASAAPPSTEPSPAPATRPGEIPREDQFSVTHHSVTIGEQKVDYDATAGTIVVKDEVGKPRADFFFVSYVRQPQAEARTRPITFVFNGGPGAAAVWLHLGAAGPRRVELGAEGIPGAPPHRLVENGQSWLDVTDLVFIDPVGTGFSRAAEGVDAQDFYGVDQDINSVGDFIRLYLTRYERWQSPKFLAGESYGTTRAAALADRLLDKWGIDLNGIVLISTVLNFETLSPNDGNDLPFALYLPTYTAIALYHHKLQADDPAKLIDEASHYAMNEYLTALSKGGNLTKEARTDLVQHLAGYTGLPAEFIDASNLRVSPDVFCKRLLNDEHLLIGRYDARVTGLDPQPASEGPQYDPSYSLYLPVYSSTFNDYIRRDLKYVSDLDYHVLSGLNWDFGRPGVGRGQGFLNVTDSLRQAMLENPHLKILVCCGYEDLATPFLAAEYTIDRLDLTDRLRANVTVTHYQGGHMMYQDPTSREQLKQNVANFFSAATKSEPENK
jgi:carboxypeptidase C (cathepsin A)